MIQTSPQCAQQKPAIASLFLSFLRLGVTAFGGPSMVAYIRTMAVDRNHWLSERSFLDGVALCQMIPGATAMQTAAYVGLRSRGVKGAAATFTGFGLPAFVLMMTLSALYARTRTLPSVVSAFNGLQAIIVAIVAYASYSFGRTSLRVWKSAFIAALAAVAFGLGLSPILVILGAALIGILLGGPALVGRRVVSTATDINTTRPLLALLGAATAGVLLLFRGERMLFDLATLMARVDLFAFGGGYASVPLMFHEIVHVRGWMDGQAFIDGIVLGQATPGPIVITATFVGYHVRGPVGGLIATIGVFLPSFLMVIGVVPHFDRFSSSAHFNRAVSGVLCSFVGLLVTVTVNFGLSVPWDLYRWLLAGAAFLALLAKVDIFWVVAAGATVSIILL